MNDSSSILLCQTGELHSVRDRSHSLPPVFSTLDGSSPIDEQHSPMATRLSKQAALSYAAPFECNCSLSSRGLQVSIEWCLAMVGQSKTRIFPRRISKENNRPAQVFIREALKANRNIWCGISIIFIDKQTCICEATHFIRTIITEAKTTLGWATLDAVDTYRQIASGMARSPNRAFSSDMGWTTWTWTSENDNEVGNARTVQPA